MKRIDIEIWKPVKDYDAYEVSNLGRVRSITREIEQFWHKCTFKRIVTGKMLKQRAQNGGYLLVWLSKNGKERAFAVHRLVAMSFIDKPLNKNDVNHKDGNKKNNNVSNLEWVNRSENIKHAYDCLGHKLLGRKVMCVDTGEVFNSLKEAGIKKNVNRVSIGHVLAGRNKTAGGYKWQNV